MRPPPSIFNRFSPRQLVASGFQTFASAPLVASDAVVGSLTVGAKRQRAFRDWERDLIESAGVRLGGAVHRAKLFQELEERHRQVEQRNQELQALNKMFQTHLAHENSVNDQSIGLAQDLAEISRRIREVQERLKGLAADPTLSTPPQPPRLS